MNTSAAAQVRYIYPSRVLASKATGTPYPVTPLDSEAVPAAAPVGTGFYDKLTERVPNGTTVVETTNGSDYPPLTQSTVVGTVTVVTTSVTLTCKAGRSVYFYVVSDLVTVTE